MPYKVVGTRVLVKRGKGWRLKKKHPTKKAARRHLRALRANVKH